MSKEKIFIGRRYLHSISSSCGAVSAMCSRAGNFQFFTAAEAPTDGDQRQTGVAGRGHIYLAVAHIHGIFRADAEIRKRFVPQGLAMVFGSTPSPLAEAGIPGKLFRQRLGGGVRLVGTTAVFTPIFFQLRQTSGMPPGYGAVLRNYGPGTSP